MLKLPVGGTRLDILERLKDPVAHFPPQSCADLATEGVSAATVATALGLSVPAASAHLELLARMGLLRAGRAAGCTVYRRDEYRIAEVKLLFEKGW
jgi:ArsR family transcriptional regulator